jgi:hypothetical protein
MHMGSFRTSRGFGVGGGADYASGAGDEVQETRSGAVKPRYKPDTWGTRLRVNSTAWGTRLEDVTAWH